MMVFMLVMVLLCAACEGGNADTGDTMSDAAASPIPEAVPLAQTVPAEAIESEVPAETESLEDAETFNDFALDTPDGWIGEYRELAPDMHRHDGEEDMEIPDPDISIIGGDKEWVITFHNGEPVHFFAGVVIGDPPEELEIISEGIITGGEVAISGDVYPEGESLEDYPVTNYWVSIVMSPANYSEEIWLLCVGAQSPVNINLDNRYIAENVLGTCVGISEGTVILPEI
jgi:hypothetical protein